jgi:glycosyltransferase involved in cell wall biosynthesis
METVRSDPQRSFHSKQEQMRTDSTRSAARHPIQRPLEEGRLRICLLSYRSNPHCGGQGVYLKNLGRALRNTGHRVEVVTGPPDPGLGAGLPVSKIPSLDLYNPEDPFRVPSLRELANPVNLLEWIGVSTMGFPEPLTFGIRAYRFLRPSLGRFDIIHDNQGLSYGVWALHRRVPTVATIHHPITVDRNIAVRAETAAWKRIKQWRWYSFVGMQKRVARTLPKIITVSQNAQRDISRDFGIEAGRFRIVPNGIDTRQFYPLPGVERDPHRIIVTTSADMPLKGLRYLVLAVAQLATDRDIRLVVVGSPKKNGDIIQLIRQLGVGHCIRFTGRIAAEEFVRQYARAAVAVVPSVYEGFGLPAGEAMACGVPVVSTSGGALPEVVGNAGILVPPSDAEALAGGIRELIEHPDRARALGRAGYERVHRFFTWESAAVKTAAVYREAIRDYRRLSKNGHRAGR